MVTQITSGWTCSECGTWIAENQSHTCRTIPVPIAPAEYGVCDHGTPFYMTCGPCDRILPGANLYITTCAHGVDLRFTPRCYLCKPIEDPIAPARGIAKGLIIGALCWVAIFAVLAVIVVWP